MSELSERVLSDLRAAFAAESATIQRYAYFAQLAEMEGQAEVARVFSDLAESLACVAHGHYDFLHEVADPVSGQPTGETSLNLVAALASELRGATEYYPQLADAALGAGLADVGSWMMTLSALKKAHSDRLAEVLTGEPEQADPPAV